MGQKVRAVAIVGYDMVKYVRKNARKGEPQSVLNTIDEWCKINKTSHTIGPDAGNILDDAVN